MQKVFWGLAIISLIIASCSSEEKTEEKDERHKETSKKEKQDNDSKDEAQKNVLTVYMSSKSGSKATGKIELVEKEGKVHMHAQIEGLTEGKHAIHIHENGDCSAEDGTSAGGHWNPTGEEHGEWGKDHHHKGDIGNLEANDQGYAEMEFSTDHWCLGCGDSKKNIIGKSFIIHAGADDFESQPSGAAGARVACGVIE